LTQLIFKHYELFTVAILQSPSKSRPKTLSTGAAAAGLAKVQLKGQGGDFLRPRQCGQLFDMVP
jgi:hypothetical protein